MAALGTSQSPPVRVRAEWLSAGCEPREVAGRVEQYALTLTLTPTLTLLSLPLPLTLTLTLTRCARRGGWLLLQHVELPPA